MSQQLTWPERLGAAIGMQAAIEELDPEQTFKGTVPRLKATEDAIAAFESQRGELLPAAYRDFLQCADGWELAYFTMDIFGLPELQGAGRWQHAQDLLSSYEAEGDLEESELEATDLLPVAAGQGSDLVVIIRDGRPDAGTVIWFDGGEYGRYTDFAEFFEIVVGMLQAWVEQQQAASVEP
ncbi:SMI1/KNR4 family protein [Glycomyces sp. NPDC047369]